MITHRIVVGYFLGKEIEEIQIKKDE